ncbi:hypothetical protein [Synechococcus sp. MVIR-18-1]|uniref:hypothetical protein n=1 Tax=Synechococcus sp. MVIR-18-1 TaxID=1386941 RepID=UPI001646068B|nr:hypothetical protein [Synechococcus sp. MVIR-18-1]QNI77702.1 putative membrane protein [Synechococcus sp. MVIR-18-1]
MSPKSQAKRIFIGFTLLVLVLFAVMLTVSPVSLIALSGEDRQIENLTAGILLATTFLSIFLYFRGSKRAKIFLIFASLGLIGFLDEISFGRRLLPVPMPKSHGLTIDGVHDLLHLIKNVANTNFTYHPVETIVVACILVMLTVFVWMKAAKSRHEIVNSLSSYGVGDLVLVLLFCIAASQAIDTFEIKIFAYRAVEECLELVGAMALMMCPLKCEEVLRHRHLVDQ